jgi:5-methylcytosine-specific restriction endonuclease McrA
MNRAKTIRELRINGMSIDDICIKLSMMDRDARHEVTSVCRKMGKPATDEEKHISIARSQLHDNEWADEYIREKTQGEWIRVSDYINMDSNIDVICKRCGYKRTVRFAAFRRKGIKVRCPICYEEHQEQKQRQKQEEKEQKKRFKEADALRRKMIKACNGRQLEFNVCSCGELIGGGSKYCARCAKRKENKSKEIRRRMKVQAAMVDRDITVDKLYKRDGGICQICGKQCDFSDCLTKDGIFYAGNNYPSIDHVMPLAKGGLHSWDNVQLAHRLCNSIKSDKVG